MISACNCVVGGHHFGQLVAFARVKKHAVGMNIIWDVRTRGRREENWVLVSVMGYGNTR